MFFFQQALVSTLLTYPLSFCNSLKGRNDETPHPTCKAIPGSSGWPSTEEWDRLNTSISGRLINPTPPGAVCHQDQSNYNQLECVETLVNWTNDTWHAANPVSVDMNNWSNDSCLPVPAAPCSGQGYPVYVINATSVADVQAGVNFARTWNVRLVVKATGHDYLGR